MASPSQSFPEIDSGSEARSSCFKKFPVSVEPIVIVLFFCYSLVDAITTNILISRTCTVIYGYPYDKCHGSIDPELEGMFQEYATKIAMYKSIIEAVIAAVMSLFIGAWIDQHGRKTFLVLPVAGYALYFISWFILVQLPFLPPVWFLIPSVFITLTGGLITVFTCVHCYITDITTDNNRALRIAAVSFCSTIGVIGGYLGSSFIWSTYGSSSKSSSIMFSIAIGVCIANLMYTTFLLPESSNQDVIEENVSRSFFNLRSVKDMFVTVFLNRPQNGTIILVLEALIIVIGIIILTGEGTYRYYAARKTFGWTLEQYNIFSASLAGLAVIASTLGTYISSSILRVHDLYIALFVALTSTLSAVLVALARTGIEFYLFSLVGCFGLLLNPMLKTHITRSVPKSELGKIFAFISTFESFVPLVTAPLYRGVYNMVLDTQPLFFLFLSASFWSLSAFLIMIVLLIKSFCTRNYNELIINANDGESESHYEGM